MTHEIPKGWATCEVQDIFRSFGGGTPSKANPSFWGGRIPWLSSGDIKGERIGSSTDTITVAGLEDSAAQLCRPGSVLVVVRSGILKHTLPVAVLEHEAAINQDIKCFDSGDDDLNTWLALALRSAARAILDLNREGTTVQSVKYETLKTFKLNVPPRYEQRRIAEMLAQIIETVDDSHARLEKVRAILKRFRQSVITAACSGRLTEDWREDRKLPKDAWPTVRVRQIAGDVSYGYTAKASSDQSGVKLLRITDIQDGRVNWATVPFCHVSASRRGHYSLSAGDIVFARTGATTGKSFLIGDCPPAVFASYLIRVRANDRVLAEFLYLFFQSADYWNQISERVSGSAQPNCNATKLAELTLGLPPIAEQREIVRRVGAQFAVTDQIETKLARATAQADRLIPSLLAKAFRGELVPTEAELAAKEGREYETADMLLERIREQRADRQTSTRKSSVRNSKRKKATAGPKTMTAIIATTNALPNGFAHSRDDLERLRNQMAEIVGTPQGVFYRDHRPDLGPRGKITRVWVDKLKRDPRHLALYCDLEYTSDKDITGATGLSISFFGGRAFVIGNQQHPQITIGAPPGLFVDPEAELFLSDVARLTGSKNAIYRDFHAHDLPSLTTGALIFILQAAAAGVVGDVAIKLAKAIVKRVKNDPASLVGRIQIRAETAHGRVEVFIPADLSAKRLQTVLDEAFKTIQEHELEEHRVFSLSIQVDNSGHVTKQETPDQAPAE